MLDTGVAPQPQEQKTPLPAWEEERQEPGEGEYRCCSWVRPSWVSACTAKNSQNTLSENVRIPWWLSEEGRHINIALL